MAKNHCHAKMASRWRAEDFIVYSTNTIQSSSDVVKVSFFDVGGRSAMTAVYASGHPAVNRRLQGRAVTDVLGGDDVPLLSKAVPSPHEVGPRPSGGSMPPSSESICAGRSAG